MIDRIGDLGFLDKPFRPVLKSSVESLCEEISLQTLLLEAVLQR